MWPPQADSAYSKHIWPPAITEILVIRRFDVTGGQLEKEASQTTPYINDNYPK